MTGPSTASAAAPTTTGIAAPGPAAAELNAQQVAERFGQVTAMIEAGNPRAAKRAIEQLAAAADDPTAALLTSCLQALERHRKVGVPMLRHLWQTTSPAGRPLVEACVPREPAGDTPPPLPAPAQRRQHQTDRGPVYQHTTRQGTAAGRRSRASAEQARDAHRYFTRDAQAGGVDALSTDPEGDTRPRDYPGWVDDEAPALVPAQGTTCLSCWIERPTAEQRRPDDDGLCGECRDRGAVGITAPGRDQAGRVRARAAHIAADAATAEQARSLLRAEYHRAHGADKTVIVDWVHQNLPT